jgi:DNA sulfur modification protein DndD
MRLIRMTVNRLGSYATEQTIDFATQSDKSITVFHGENGAGKTSTLNSVLWGLTGQVSPSMLRNDPKDQLEVIVNHTSIENGIVPAVKIEFEHEGTEYRAVRKLIGNRIEGTFELWAKRNGILDPYANSSEDVMRKILPHGLARYFIFDGEGFAKSAAHSQTIFRTSVENILGFDFLDRAIDRIEKVKSRKVSEAAKIAGKKISDQKKRSAYERAVQQLDESRQEIEKFTEQIAVFKENLEMVRTNIAALNIKQVEKLQKTKLECERDITKLFSEQKYFESERLNLISKYYRAIFGRRIISDSLGMIEAQRQKKIIPGPFDRQFINDLISDGTCICGECLDDVKIATLRQALQQGYTSSMQQRLTRAQAVLADDYDKVEDFQKYFQEFTIGIADKKTQIENKRETYEVAKNELDEIGDREKSLRQYQNEEVRILASLRKVEDDLSEARTSKESAEIIKNSYAGVIGIEEDALEIMLGNQVKKLHRVIEYGKSYKQREMEWCHKFIRSEMQSFIDGTNIPYTVTLDSHFKFYFQTDSGRRINGSTGEQKTLEFAFLCTLVKLVKEKSANTNGLLIPASSVPLVIDAPFSDVAEKYIKYISDMLLEVSEQLTILTINKDWPALENATQGRVGKEYLLIKNIVQSSDDKIQEKHIFRGKEYTCVNYNASYLHTTIEEVVDG